MINKKQFYYINRIANKTQPLFNKTNRFSNHYLIKEKSSKTNDLIHQMIISGKPFMVGRLGSVETRLIVNTLLANQDLSDLKATIQYLKGNINIYWRHDENYFDKLLSNAGFFPNNKMLIPAFINCYLEAVKSLDVLGVWNGLEEYVPNIPTASHLSNIRELEPWFFNNPWSKALHGKKVLVIHPFEDTIIEQYKKRQNIYINSDILPEFQLKTIKAVQSIADQKDPNFETWFDALDDMKNQIDSIDFDIAIIGCGAYGFPLAAYVKQIGKQAIHLGGVTQLLFGIKGKRWEDWKHYTDLRGTQWVNTTEKPQGFDKIEGGCYW